MAASESIEWIATADELPDADQTVLIFVPEASEPIWLGYYEDGLDPCWRYIDGGVVFLTVTHWAELPEGPKQ